jgi:hypothetical protein
MCAKSVKPHKLHAPRTPEQIAELRKLYIKIAAFVCIVVGSYVGISAMRRHVERDITASSEPPKVVLKNRPAWMSSFLADKIIATASPKGPHSAFDHQLLKDVADQLTSDPDISPWIRRIRQVRRTYIAHPGDTIEVDCEFRDPVALVHWNDTYHLVDSEGVTLPEQYAPDQVRKVALTPSGKIALRIIEGTREVPGDPGVKLGSEDVLAGLEMINTLHGQSFADEILGIDVANYQGRDDASQPFIKLLTRYNTQIMWGRQPSAKDAFIEVSPERKLIALQKICRDYGRVDANRAWIDIRFDKIISPNPEATTASATDVGK